MPKRLRFVLAVLGVCAAGLSTWLLAFATAPAAAQAEHRAVPTTITVTAGKPSELSFKFSKVSFIPAGTVIFKVTNMGKTVHDFKVCTIPSSTLLDTCTGKVTKRLKAGQSATLTVVLKNEGKYEFLCTVPGHASAGMKGQIGIGVKVTNATATAAGTSTVKPAASSPTGAKCTSPQTTTVTVDEFDFGFRLSPSTAPCGTITFKQSNSGQAIHDFVVPGVGRGDRVNPGQSTTMTATNVGPGSYQYLCTVEGHDTLGMVGTFTVSG
jgi:uncharacterized cupredoxin-like copper-binding protein